MNKIPAIHFDIDRHLWLECNREVQWDVSNNMYAKIIPVIDMTETRIRQVLRQQETTRQ